jgi:hypothetical protein
MRKIARWLLLTFVLTCVLFSVVLFILHRWIATDDFRLRAQAQASELLGREVRLGVLTVDVWPLPAVALNRVEIATQPLIRIERIEARPVLAALLSGRLELSTLLVRQADVSQAAADDLLAAHNDRRRRSDPGATGALPPTDVVQVVVPQRVVLDAATWRNATGAVTMFDADARLDSQGLPDTLAVTLLAGALQGTRLSAQRVSGQNEWGLDLEIAGGSVKGKVQLPTGTGTKPAITLTGQLETRNVALGVLIRAQQQAQGIKPAASRAALSGRLEASTHFEARSPDWAGLAAGLQSDSRFVVHQAVVHGIDLARAVRTVGLSRGGETRLDTLSGQVRTQDRTVDLRNLVASSGALSAAGQVLITSDRQLQGRIDVHLGAKMMGKAVGVPLVVEGTLDKPQLRLTRAALAGAAIGSLIMPGVGTGAGATLGEKIGEGLKGLFGK